MKFYSELSRVYDIVFPLDEDTFSFLIKDLKPNSNVMDMACGTGSYSLAIAEIGHNVTGIDLGQKMIELAERKNEASKSKIKFYCMDMREAAENFKDEKYDLIYCIGNSLVHLNNAEEIEKLIKDMFNMVEDGGQIILQIINYDRIINEKITSLPTIERKDDGVKFVRNYRHSEDDSVIYFDTELIINDGENSGGYKNSVPLLPLKSRDMKNILKNAGFKDINLYGDFDSVPYNEKSFALVVRAVK